MISVDQIIQRLADHHVLDPTSSVEPDTELLESGLIDSLGVVALLGWLEEAAGVEIDPIDVVVENFETPSAIARMIDDVGA